MSWLFLTTAHFPFIATEEQENESVPLSLRPDVLSKSQLDDCPRDSGCYISSGNSDNGKEDLESENLPDMVQKIAITEPSDWTHIHISLSTEEFHLNSSSATRSNGNVSNASQSANCFNMNDCTYKFISLNFQWVCVKCIFIKYYVL